MTDATPFFMPHRPAKMPRPPHVFGERRCEAVKIGTVAGDLLEHIAVQIESREGSEEK